MNFGGKRFCLLGRDFRRRKVTTYRHGPKGSSEGVTHEACCTGGRVNYERFSPQWCLSARTQTGARVSGAVLCDVRLLAD